MNKALFSSIKNDWSTPPNLFNELNTVYNFTLDPCCSVDNAKCITFFTENDNGLDQSWKGYTVFMNPPYGKTIKAWMCKAYEEHKKHGITVVCLVPARTDTSWWHDYAMKAKEIMFIRGRVKFGNGKGSAPFPSAIVIFRLNWFQKFLKGYKHDSL